MNKQGKKYDIIVVGAGIIGASFALAAAHNKTWRIALIEQSSSLKSALNTNAPRRIVALGEIATQCLQKVGAFDEYFHAYRRMHVWDGHSQGELSFCASEHNVSQLGYMADANRVTQKLQQLAQAHSHIDVFFEQKIQRIHQEKQSVYLQSDTLGSIQADMLVGADGAHSWVRQQSKILRHAQSYQQQAIVAEVDTSKSHQDTAWQVFAEQGCLAALPLANNRSSLVWSLPIKQAENVMTLSRNECEKRLTSAFGNKLGKAHLQTELRTFALHSYKLEQYYQEKIILLGDAAHQIHPLAGQGANLGFKDLQLLVHYLDKVIHPSDVPLHDYQRLRKADNHKTDAAMSTLLRIFQQTTPWITALRGLGMQTVDHSRWLKTLCLQQALGNMRGSL